MDVYFKTDKLKKLCESEKELTKKFGFETSKVIKKRMVQLWAAPNLEELFRLPGRCHELKADRKGQLAIDIKHPKRIVFVPDHAPMPYKNDGGIDLRNITKIQIIGICDYH